MHASLRLGLGPRSSLAVWAAAPPSQTPAPAARSLPCAAAGREAQEEARGGAGRPPRLGLARPGATQASQGELAADAADVCWRKAVRLD